MKIISLQSSHLKIPETTIGAIRKAAEIFTSENLEDGNMCPFCHNTIGDTLTEEDVAQEI